MKHDHLADALNEVSDTHIKEAAQYRRKNKLVWLGAVAAVLAIVLVFRVFEVPMVLRAQAVSTASESRVQQRPDLDDYENREVWLAALEAWEAQREARSTTVSTANTQMAGFLLQSCQEFLGGSEENRLYSPINAYIGLAMAAELTGGETRQQLLNALGAPDTQALRSQVSALWETVYRDDGHDISTLASSLWLDEDLDFHQDVMDTLAYDYYASVYQSPLSDPQTVRDIAAWLNRNTGGLLKEYTSGIRLPEEALLALYSTIYFQAKWTDEFSITKNTIDTFHGTAGDSSRTFMNAPLRQMHYYWGDSYGAVFLNLKNGSNMWFILPDAGKSVSDILAEGQYLEMITAPYEGWENCKYMKVNLSVPKFDIQGQVDLRSGLEQMGIKDMFQFGTADFSPSFDEPAHFTAAMQTVRVAIDEQGVTAAAYIELPAAGAAPPPEEIIDFILDRPFLFVIERSGIPLFAGTVNQL